MKASLIVVSLLVSLDSFAGYVADPFRAADVTWPKYPVKGKDCWVMLDPRWRTLDGVKDMDFVKEAGYYNVRFGSDPLIQSYSRVIHVGGLKLLDAAGKPVAAKDVSLASEEAGAIVQDGTDEKGVPFKVLSAPFIDVKVRYLPAKGLLKISSETPFSSVAFSHKVERGATVATVSGASAPADVALGKADCRVTFRRPQTEATVTLVSPTPGMRFTAPMVSEEILADFGRKPFMCYSTLGRWGTVGAPATFSGKRELDTIAARYPETFLGLKLGEWDANLLQKFNGGASGFELRDLRRVMKIPCDRNEMVANLKARYDELKGLNGARSYGLSGGITFMHYACDFGSTIAAIESSGERTLASQRNMLLHTAAAGRQFGVPFELYIAYFCGSAHPCSQVMAGQGTDWGMSPSLGLRNYFTTYYMGCNYYTFESQPFGQVEEENKTYKLTANGEAIREISEWTKKPEGKRGEFYAPILVLQDRRAGDDQAWPLTVRRAAFYGLYEATDGDCMNEYIARAIAAPDDHHLQTDPKGGTCHFNSRVGNVVLMYHANPIVHGDVTLGQIAKYPVVVISGDHVWSENLANVVKRYVYEGGTLVITAGQCDPFDAQFLGYRLTGGETVSDGLFLANGKVEKGATVLKATSDGKPLVVANRYGRGQVDFVTSPFFKRVAKARNPAERFRFPPQLEELFVALQDEVLPAKVRGSGEFTVNRAADGSWIYCLVNNIGSVKDPRETHEHFLPEYAQEMTLTLPAGATAKEIRLGAQPTVCGNDWTFRVPPAGVLVVKITGAQGLVARPSQSNNPTVKQSVNSFSPVRNFTQRFALTGVANDGYRKDPAKFWPKGKAPALVGEWLAANDYRDTSGNGHDLKAMKRGPFDYRSTFVRTDYTLYNCTFETWVKPAEASAFQSDRGGSRGAQGGVFRLNDSVIYLLWSKGRWTLASLSSWAGRRVDMVGPKAVAGKWTHLCVTLDHDVMRLYVDGVEAVGECGPVRIFEEQGIMPQGNFIDLVYGSSEPSWGLPFRGEMSGLKFYSRTFSPDEVTELAGKRW